MRHVIGDTSMPTGVYHTTYFDGALAILGDNLTADDETALSLTMVFSHLW